MNFLAHHLIATRFLTPAVPLPMYVVGSALPDLLPLAARRVRLRPALVERQPAPTDDEGALRAGVLVHLATDSAFHKTPAFAEAQAEAGRILDQAAFDGIRVRRFFVAHVLVELALDAVLLRRDSTVAHDFYTAFAADYADVMRWTEATVGQSLPALPTVLKRFAESRYLEEYREDEGVATGLSRLCARAQQDTFEGENYARLVEAVGRTVAVLEGHAAALLEETGRRYAGIRPGIRPGIEMPVWEALRADRPGDGRADSLPRNP